MQSGHQVEGVTAQTAVDDPGVTIHWEILLGAFLLAGCTLSPARQFSYAPPPGPTTIRQDEWQKCLKEEVGQRVFDLWAGPASRGEYPPTIYGPYPGMSAIAAAALQKCFPSYKIGQPGYAGSPEMEADLIYDQARQNYVDKIDRVLTARRMKTIADNQAKLTSEDPAAIAAWRRCIVGNARQLAQLTQESAEAVTAAAFAACRLQRRNLVELHERYDDAKYSDAIMDDIERRLTGDLILEVIRTRAQRSAPVSPPKPPPLPTNRDDQSI
jgi:hypothetical protein